MNARAPSRPISLGRAHLLISTLIRDARTASAPIDNLIAVGDVRRFEPEMSALVLLGTAPVSAHAANLAACAALPTVLSSKRIGERSLRIALERSEVLLHLTPEDQAGAAMVWYTGSAGHVEQLQARARERGLTFDEGRLATFAATPVACPSEEDLYRRLDLPFIAPELRGGTDEVARAESGMLPRLVTGADVRGDLHTHTTWSDGTDTTERMVTAARQLGYEYVAITDHSHRSPASRTLSPDDVVRQRAEIASVQSRFRSIVILHGIEVDIMPDGQLDFDDEILRGFDIVLGSLHMDEGQGGGRLTDRYLTAIRHPLVNVITHPANRMPARSSGFDVDFDALFAAAAETGTAMEIDGAPGHLDMDGALARRAVAAGVTVTIDSDCHKADWLGRQMRFGVGTARRGWIEPQSVLNTRGVQVIREFVARKRTRG